MDVLREYFMYLLFLINVWFMYYSYNSSNPLERKIFEGEDREKGLLGSSEPPFLLFFSLCPFQCLCYLEHK